MIDRVDEITDAFGLMGLRDGPHKIRDKDNNVIEKIMVESFWAMETAYFTKAESLTVAVVHTSSWSKGLLLIPSPHPEERAFCGPTPIQPVELVDWPDAVREALHCVDLMVEDRMRVLGRGTYSYDLIAGGSRSYAEFIFSVGYPGMPSAPMNRLWEALVATVYDLVERYDDDEMREFVGPMKHFHCRPR